MPFTRFSGPNRASQELVLSRHGRACLDFEVAWSNAAGVNWNLPTNLLLGSSMVEHSAVNRRVVGSSPTRGANTKFRISNTALEDTRLTERGAESIHRCKFTHPYPNFLILIYAGYPQFPPSVSSTTPDEPCHSWRGSNLVHEG